MSNILPAFESARDAVSSHPSLIDHSPKAAPATTLRGERLALASKLLSTRRLMTELRALTAGTLFSIILVAGPVRAFGEATSTTLDMDGHIQNLGSPNGATRVEAKNAIYAARAEAIPALVRGLANPNAGVRRQSLRLLREFGPQVAAEQIVLMAKSDPDTLIRSSALDALRCIEHPQTITVAKQVAETEQDYALRTPALRVVGKKLGEASIPWLTGFLKSSDAVVAAAAAKQLASLGDARGYEIALSILKSTSTTGSLSHLVNAQTAALGALFALAKPASLPALEEFVAQDIKANRFSRMEAIATIEHIKLQQVPPEKRLPLLSDALRSERHEVRDWAAQELSGLGDELEVRQLLDAAVEDPRHPGQREAANVLRFFEERRENPCQ